jgi:tetratricopeptide (TPR) repeat protein
MDSLHSTYDAIRHALNTGDRAQAFTLLKQALDTFPHFVDAQQLLGEAHLQAEQYMEAIAAFERALQANPEHADALYGLGVAHHHLGHDAEAHSAFQRALEIQPTLLERRALLKKLFSKQQTQPDQLSRAGRARLYLRSGKYGQAIDIFRTLLAHDPHRSDIEAALAEALWRAKRGAEMQRLCYDLLALRPQLLKPTLLLAYSLLARREPGGEALWRRALTQDPLQMMAKALFPKLPNVALSNHAARIVPSPKFVVKPEAGASPADEPPRDAALLAQLLGDAPLAAEPTEQDEPPTDTSYIAPDDILLLDQLLSELPASRSMQPVLASDATGDVVSTNILDIDEVMITPAHQEDMPADIAQASSAEALPVESAAAPPGPIDEEQPPVSASLAGMEEIFEHADSESANHVLRLAVARLGWQLDHERALALYKRLIKDGVLLDETVDDLLEHADAIDDPQLRQHVYRLLGDAYMHQHRVSDAMSAYDQAFPERGAARRNR